MNITEQFLITLIVITMNINNFINDSHETLLTVPIDTDPLYNISEYLVCFNHQYLIVIYSSINKCLNVMYEQFIKQQSLYIFIF